MAVVYRSEEESPSSPLTKAVEAVRARLLKLMNDPRTPFVQVCRILGDVERELIPARLEEVRLREMACWDAVNARIVNPALDTPTLTQATNALEKISSISPRELALSLLEEAFALRIRLGETPPDGKSA